MPFISRQRFLLSLALIALISIPFMLGCKKESSAAETDATTNNQPENATEWTKNAVIYEVNIRQYSPEGTLNKVAEDLQRIKDLGVDVVWLMPIHPIGEKNRKGTMGSYYAVKDYKAVNPEFGTLADLKSLINKAHSLGMKVIIDWVANHSSPDNVWIKDHLDYYTKDSLGNAPIPTLGTDWTDVADLNYDNPAMRAAMLDAMKYWVTEADIDGFRCDVAGMVPLDFWQNTTTELNKIKPLFWLAEDANPKIHQAFHMSYAWPLKDLMVKMAKGDAKLSELAAYQDSIKAKYQPKDILMTFTTNHDENSWHGSVLERFGENHLNYAVMAYTQGGMPLIYSGQEAGMPKALAFFEKDPIPWGNYKFTDFYKNVIRLYKDNPALWNGADKGDFELIKQNNDQLLIYRKFKGANDLIFVQNYSNQPIAVKPELLKGYQTDLDLLTNAPINGQHSEGLKIEPHKTLVFKK